MKIASLKFLFSLNRNNSKVFIQDLLEHADIKINGDRSWDIQVHNEDFYARVLSQGSLGLGESYMDGWWDCQELDQFIYRVIDAELNKKVSLNWTTIINILRAKLINLQSKTRAFEVGECHYDLDNTLFEKMLDPYMQYSCGYCKDAKDLAESQEHKMDLICRKLQLQPGMKVLDIGCGWGGLARYMVQEYGIEVVGVTISKEQADYAKEHCKNLPISIRLQDYRRINEKFDRIVSVGMFEHVGYKNYANFMKIVNKCLKDDGLFLLHTIGNLKSVVTCNPWFNKYIFPNGQPPSMKQISDSVEGVFVMEDWHSFGYDYSKTLRAWHTNINFNNHWGEVCSKYDERFHRMWNYYLLSLAGGFEARCMQLWQMVFSKKGVKGGYTSNR